MSKLSRNIIYNFFGQGLLLILGFVAVKYVFARLGEDAVGLIFFAATLNAVLCPILDMGLGSTTVREVSAHIGDDPAYVSNLLRTFSLIYWGVYLLLALGMYWGAPLLVAKWINLRTLQPAAATEALRILGMGALLALPRSFYTSVVRGLERMEFNNLIDVATSALQQFGTIGIVIFSGQLLSVVYWLAACFVLGVVGYILVCARLFSLRALLPGFSIPILRRNLSFTSRAASISILAMIHTQADKAIVSKLLPLGVFGYYSFAWSAISRGTLVTSAVSQAAFPSFSVLFKAGERINLTAQYRKLQDLLCFGTVPLFAAIPFAALPLFSYLLNAQAAELLLLPTALLCIGFYMNGTLGIPYVFSLAVGKPEIVARLNFYALFVVLPMTIVLVYFFGLNGAGFSWVVYHLFAYTYAVPRISSECLDLPASVWYLHVVKVALVAGLAYGTAWGVFHSVNTQLAVRLALAYGAATFVFLLAAYFLIGDELRTSLNQLLLLRQRGPRVLPV